MVGREFIQNPGPTNIPDEVLEAFRRPPVDFDSPFFGELVDRVWAELPGLFGGASEVFVLTSVGHGAWESVLQNLLAPGIDHHCKPIKPFQPPLQTLAGHQFKSQVPCLFEVLKKKSVLDIDVMSAHRATTPSCIPEFIDQR